MQLTTARLILTQLQPQDWLLFQRVHTDEQSMAYISAIPSTADIRQRFNDRLAPWQITCYHMLCLVARRKDTGDAIGLLGVNAEWAPCRQAEVGYSLLNAYCGQGYGGEALAALCHFLFDECGFHKLKASVVEGNIASRRILEKNGFLLEGTLRDDYFLRGHWVNNWVFGRLSVDN